MAFMASTDAKNIGSSAEHQAWAAMLMGQTLFAAMLLYEWVVILLMWLKMSMYRCPSLARLCALPMWCLPTSRAISEKEGRRTMTAQASLMAASGGTFICPWAWLLAWCNGTGETPSVAMLLYEWFVVTPNEPKM